MPNPRTLLTALAFAAALVGTAHAQDGATCTVTAGEKKLAGAAKNSFTKKCVKDAVGE